MNIVTFPTILNLHGVDPAHIGISFTLDIVGGIVMSIFLSRLVAKLGMMNSLRLAAFAYAGLILVIYFYKNFLLWISIVFLMGACWFIYVIVRQSWLNIILENKQRGIGLGIFSMTTSAGVALGPIIVSFCGASNYLSFLISAALVILSFLCLIPLKSSIPPKIASRPIYLKDFFKKNPLCFLARFFLDFQSYLLLTFSVIFGVKIGLSYEAAGLLISAYMASAFCDVWVGFLLKKTKPFKLINIGFLGCLYCFLFIILYHESYFLLLVTYFLFGIFVACIYVSVFKVMNEDYHKEKLVAANATFQLIGAIGSICGSLAGGYLVNIFGTNGFPITISLSCILYISFLIIYDKKNSC